MERKINKVHIKHNWYARIIEFLNKAYFDDSQKRQIAYRNDLLTWNNWGNAKLSYKPPAFIDFNRNYFNGKAAYYIGCGCGCGCIKIVYLFKIIYNLPWLYFKKYRIWGL